MQEDYIEVDFSGHHTKLNFEEDYAHEIRRVIVLPGEIIVVYLERNENGQAFIRDGDVAERAEVHRW